MPISALTPPPLRADDLLANDSPLPRQRLRWLTHPVIRLLLMAALTAVLAVLAGVVIAAFGGTDAKLAWAQIAVVGGAYLVLVLWIEGRRPPLELDPRRLAGLPIGLALGSALFVVCFGVITLLGGYRFDGVDGGYSFGVPWLVLGLSAGVTEEIVFRGVLFRMLEEWLGTWWSVGISGLVFGMLHLGNQNATLWGALAIALEAGLMFAVLYALTRSLWVVIGVHAAWNVMQGPVLGIQVSGSGFAGGWLQTVPVGPDWLTGGQFGAEASVVTVVLLVGFTAWLAVRLQRSGQVVRPAWTRARLITGSAAHTPRPDPR